jgi:hypothetical protein
MMGRTAVHEYRHESTNGRPDVAQDGILRYGSDHLPGDHPLTPLIREAIRGRRATHYCRITNGKYCNGLATGAGAAPGRNPALSWPLTLAAHWPMALSSDTPPIAPLPPPPVSADQEIAGPPWANTVTLSIRVTANMFKATDLVFFIVPPAR